MAETKAPKVQIDLSPAEDAVELEAAELEATETEAEEPKEAASELEEVPEVAEADEAPVETAEPELEVEPAEPEPEPEPAEQAPETEAADPDPADPEPSLAANPPVRAPQAVVPAAQRGFSAWMTMNFPGHEHAVLGGFAGLLVALLVFGIGAARTAFMLAMITIGVAYGQHLDGDARIVRALRRPFEKKQS